VVEMNIDELTPEEKEVIQDAGKVIREIGEGFKPYLITMFKANIKDPKEQLLTFGNYLKTCNRDIEGYKWLSKTKFFEFVWKDKIK
jgi:hypothetical protein